MTAVNMRPEPPSEALFVLGIPGIWFIVSGLPRTMGLSKEERRSRQKRYSMLVLSGFVVFVIASTVSLLQHHLSVVSIVLVGLFIYFWTWFSWLIADRWIRNRIERAAQQTPQ
jgi:membrane-associated phospholipid phosphatase